MANKQYALEWLELAKHNLEAAKLLYDSKHYTDVIAIELHQALEKTIKAVYAYNNIKIVKTHNLIRLANNCDLSQIVQTDDNIMEIASDYYTENRYPGTTYQMPERKELDKVMNFARELYEKIHSYIS
jgi:HEPN domain-containing protein